MAIEMQSVINGFLEGSIRTAGKEPVINELIVSENGTYTAPSDIDGYSPVIVNVPKTPLNKLTVTENGTYTAPTDTGYDEVNVNVPLPSNAYLLKEIEDVDIASFSDGSNLPMPKFQVGIEPRQDLHGYDAPWVGGAGKNKFNWDAWKGLVVNNGTAVYENNGITITATRSDAYTAYTNWGDDRKIFVTEGETVTLSWEETTNKHGDIYIFPNGDTAGLVMKDNANAKELSYTVGSGITFITFRFGVRTSGETISYKNIMVRKNGDNTFEPYSNICPISGHTEANIVVSPTEDAEDGTTYNIQFKDGDNPLTVYGGTLDVVSGELKVVPYYASYNGETLDGEWISDRDVYAVGSTPTIGAQVVNIGATPQVIQLTPTQIVTLPGNNVITADTGSINIEYFAK